MRILSCLPLGAHPLETVSSGVLVPCKQMFLHQLERTAGTAAVPPGVLRVLAARACHTAIRCAASHVTQQLYPLACRRAAADT